MDQQQTNNVPPHLVDELRDVIASGEEILRHSREQAGEEYRRSRAKFEAILADIKQSVASAETAAINKARLASAKADLYVHTHPWQSVGYGAATAAVIGVLVGLLIGRR